MYNISDKSSAVKEVQRYLIALDRASGIEPRLVADGIYDHNTSKAVRRFQEDNFLMPTGNVDYETFSLLYENYLLALEISALPRCVNVLPYKLDGGVLRAGEKSSTVAVIQALLKSLEIFYDDFTLEINGVFDDATAEAVKAVQRTHSLEENGIIDRKTFDAITADYEKYIDMDM